MPENLSLSSVYGDPENSYGSESGEAGSEVYAESSDPFGAVHASYEVLDNATEGAPELLFDQYGAPVAIKPRPGALKAPVRNPVRPLQSRQPVKLATPKAISAVAGLPAIPPTMKYVKPIIGTIGVPPFNLAQEFDSEMMLFFNQRLREVSPYWTVEKSAIPVANVATVTLAIGDFDDDVAFTEAVIAMLDIKLGVSMIQSLPDLVVPLTITGVLMGGDAYSINMTIHYDARKGARLTFVPHRLVKDKAHPSMVNINTVGPTTCVIVASNVPDDSQLVVRVAGPQEQEWLDFMSSIKKGRI